MLGLGVVRVLAIQLKQRAVGPGPVRFFSEVLTEQHIVANRVDVHQRATFNDSAIRLGERPLAQHLGGLDGGEHDPEPLAIQLVQLTRLGDKNTFLSESLLVESFARFRLLNATNTAVFVLQQAGVRVDVQVTDFGAVALSLIHI